MSVTGNKIDQELEPGRPSQQKMKLEMPDFFNDHRLSQKVANITHYIFHIVLDDAFGRYGSCVKKRVCVTSKCC